MPGGTYITPKTVGKRMTAVTGEAVSEQRRRDGTEPWTHHKTGVQAG